MNVLNEVPSDTPYLEHIISSYMKRGQLPIDKENYKMHLFKLLRKTILNNEQYVLEEKQAAFVGDKIRIKDENSYKGVNFSFRYTQRKTACTAPLPSLAKELNRILRF